MTKVNITDPRDLLPHEEERLAELQDMPIDAFTEAVRYFATCANPTEAEQVIFRHPDLAQATYDALRRLIRATERAKGKESSKTLRTLLDHELKMLGAARKELGAYVNLAISETARGDEERRALSVLRRIHYVEYVAILADIRHGESVKRAEEKARQRRHEAAKR